MTLFMYISLILSIVTIGLIMMYPLWSNLMAYFFKKEIRRSEEYIVPVSIVICCYNEAETITSRIQHFLDEKEWIPGSEILIVSGGSTDGTTEIIKSFTHEERIKTFLFETQMPKTKGLNFVVPKCKNEILIFSDCRQFIAPGSVRNLIYNFNDPEIGTVGTTLVDTKCNSKPSFMRMLLKNIALSDSQYGSCLNLHGALYAQRKSVFREMPSNLLFEDLFVVVSTIVQGKRIIQEPKSVIYDINFQSYYQSERIRRLARGLLIFIQLHFKLIFSMPTAVLIRFLIFKYLKLLIPIALALTIICCLPLLFSFPSKHLGAFIITLLVVSLIKSSRRILVHVVQFNYNFLASIVNFVIKKNRSIQWKKLETKN